MKKTAVLIYEQFCNFEMSVVLEILAMARKPITIFAKDTQPVKSEEGLIVLPNKSINEMEIDDYDSLILPGAMDIRTTIEDEKIIEFIKKFNRKDMVIGAISIAPLLLLKAGMLEGKKFMAGVTREDLYEEGYPQNELLLMVDWEDNLENLISEGYVISDNVITSVSYEFVRWSLALGKMIGIDLPPQTFGIRDTGE